MTNKLIKITISPNTPNEEEVFIDADEIKDNGDGTITFNVRVGVNEFKNIMSSEGTS